ncbi:MAG TPA: argininosuccinate lyase [Candidatus Dormibacteraeota bacterium]|nr:argininosuccinate lyase [Candidatus Dormibacteraeota bacterium]
MAEPRIRVVGAGVQSDADRELPEPRPRAANRVIGTGGAVEKRATGGRTTARVGARPRAQRAAAAAAAVAAAAPAPADAPAVAAAATAREKAVRAAVDEVAEPRVEKAFSGRLPRTAKRVEEFTASLPVDRRLVAEDVAGSRAHAKMLRGIGVLTGEEQRAIDSALREIRREIERGDPPLDDGDEDIHMAVERRLVEKIGEPGGKLHTARSRNDQVATDLRLWTKRVIRELMLAVADLQEALLRRAQEHRTTLIPGYTHLQRAQVVSLAHHLLAYSEMLQRDVERLEDCHERTDVLPLGSGALAATTLPLNRRVVADELGFDHVSANSLDAVSDRDFAVELAGVCSLLMVHFSRMAEDLILWSTREFGFAELPDAYATGSSLMPQKKNPDVLELVRGRVGRVVGAQVALLMTLKALPLSYNRDLQEDKESLFAAVDTTQACTAMLTDVMRVVRFSTAAMEEAASDPDLIATDVAEHLVVRGIPFREAHRIVGRAVRAAARSSAGVAGLDVDAWRALDPRIDADTVAGLRELFDPRESLARRAVAGGPAPQMVRRQLVRAAAAIAKTRRLVPVMAGTAVRAREVGAEARR